MSDSFSKKEKEKRRQQKKKEKEQRKSERKDQEKSGSLEDMIAYVDENGNISSTPPDPSKRKEIEVEAILIGPAAVIRSEEPTLRTGRITSFNQSKGYGFIRDQQTQQSIFVHISALLEPVDEGALVSFEVEQGERGLAAKSVRPA